jgi:hypothetical protein
MTRRTSDDRFDYTWHWHGKLATAAVKDCWPIESGESQYPSCAAGFTHSPYAVRRSFTTTTPRAEGEEP